MIKKYKSLPIEKQKIIKFFLSLSASLTIFYILLSLEYLSGFVAWLSKLDTRVAGEILKYFNKDVSYFNILIMCKDYTITVAYGCEGTEPIILFLLAILSFPSTIKSKIIPILFGPIILFIVNIIRIIVLFKVGVNNKGTFDFLHHDIFPFAIMIIEIIMWILWVKFIAKDSYGK